MPLRDVEKQFGLTVDEKKADRVTTRMRANEWGRTRNQRKKPTRVDLAERVERAVTQAEKHHPTIAGFEWELRHNGVDF